jgi:hypothetical protein
VGSFTGSRLGAFKVVSRIDLQVLFHVIEEARFAGCFNLSLSLCPMLSISAIRPTLFVPNLVGAVANPLLP